MEIISVNPILILKHGSNFTYADPTMEHFLLESLRIFGQLQPIIVYKDSADRAVAVSGRRILNAAIKLNFNFIFCVVIDKLNIENVQLALKEISFETDYILMSKMKSDFLPYDEEMKQRLKEISEFDWKNINKQKDENQVKLSFD